MLWKPLLLSRRYFTIAFLFIVLLTYFLALKRSDNHKRSQIVADKPGSKFQAKLSQIEKKKEEKKNQELVAAELLLTEANAQHQKDAELLLQLQKEKDENSKEEEVPRLISSQEMSTICASSSSLWCPQLIDKLEPFEFKGCKLEKKTPKVSFLKTHKTGSSTVASIMYRYYEHSNGLLHGLFPKPSMNPWRSTMTYPWDPHYRANNLYEFFAFHTSHYRINAWETRFGKDTNFITILREPANNFESSYSYFGREKKLHMTAKEYLQKLNTSYTFRHLESHKSWYSGLNPQIKDLGLPARLTLDDEAVTNYISDLHQHFSLVLINEEFDESVVLLSQLLCMPLRNVTYLNQKMRVDAHRTPLDDSDRSIVKGHFRADYKLYEKAEVESFGVSRMKIFAQQVKEMNKYISTKCGVDTSNTARAGGVRESIANTLEANANVDHECFLTALIERKFKRRLVTIEAGHWRAFKRMQGEERSKI